MMSSAAEVLAAYLVAEGLATRPKPVAAWPVSVNAMPPDAPDNRLTIYNSGAESQAKNHRTGETYLEHECQIRVRSKPGSPGYQKLMEILEKLSVLYAVMVTTDVPETVQLLSVTHKSGPMFLTQEENNQRIHHVMTVSVLINPGV